MKSTRNTPLPKLLILAGCALATSQADAGTVNLDFHNPGEAVATGAGAIGSGTHWNDYHTGIPNRNNLADENGAITTVGGSIVAGVGDGPFLSGNDVTRDGIRNFSPADTVFEINNLRPNEPYKVVVYAFYNNARTLTVNTVASGFNGRTGSPLPGVEGSDYALIERVLATAAGKIVVTVAPDTGAALASGIAGIQIQGWFKNEPKPWKADLSIGRTRNGDFKGNDFYSKRPSSRQSLAQRNRRARFFFKLQNDGSTFGTFLMEGTRKSREALRKYIAIPGGNVSGRIFRGTWNEEIGAGETVTLKAIVKRGRRSRGTIKTHLEAFPERNTLPSKKDVSTAILR